MELKKIQKEKAEKKVVVSARIPKDYKSFITTKKINLSKLITTTIDELRKNKGGKK